MSARNRIHLIKLWKLGIGAVASVAILLPMGAVANAEEKEAASSATTTAIASTSEPKTSGNASSASDNVIINNTNFPDKEFRGYVSKEIDQNHDGVLNQTERNQVSKISDWGPYPEGFSTSTSLKGIEFFPNLEEIQLWFGKLTTIDVSHNPKLESLYLDTGNRLTSLDVSHNPKLTGLTFYGDGIKTLDLSHNLELQYLNIASIGLTTLDLSHNRKLESLGAYGNELTSIDLSHSKIADSHQARLDQNRMLAYRGGPKINDFYLSAQRPYEVDGAYLNLKKLIPWFDVSKVTNLKGGTLSRDGLLVPSGTKAGSMITYNYGAADGNNLPAKIVFSMKGGPYKPAPVIHTVAFNSAGGSAVASQRVANGGKAKQPANPTRSGYTFAGWYYGDVKWDFNRGVTANITLTAHWTKNSTPAPQVKQVPVYRVYNRNSGLHHYTVSKAENDMLIKIGWRDENRGGSAFVTVSRDTPGARPVYREYNRRSGNHNWTLNKKEHDMLVRLGWRDEGIAWYTSPTGRDVYRLYNPKPYHKPKNGRGNGGGEHVYTTSYGEYRAVVRAGWRGEGVAWKSL